MQISSSASPACSMSSSSSSSSPSSQAQPSSIYMQSNNCNRLTYSPSLITPTKHRLKYETTQQQTICAINDAYLSTIEKTMLAAAQAAAVAQQTKKPMDMSNIVPAALPNATAIKVQIECILKKKIFINLF